MINISKKINLFFFCALFTGGVSFFSVDVAYLFSAAVIIFFFSGIFRYVLLVAVLSVFMINSYITIITDKAYENKNYKTYYTVDGKIRTSENFLSGDIVVGYKQKTKGENFYKINGYTNFRLPLISALLKYRVDLGEKIFLLSGGKVQILQGLVLGDKRYIENYKKDLFTVSGLNHYLAISGMHIGIIGAIFMICIPFIHRKLKIIILSVFMIFFIFVSGVKIPVLRTIIFLSIFSICYILNVKMKFKEFVILIGSLFIILSPTIITNISYLLSFSAVLGIAFLVDKKNTVLMNAIITSVAATVFTSPFVLYYFGLVNIFSIFNTIIIFPIIYLHILTGIIGLFWADFIINPAVITENILIRVLEFLSSFERIGVFTNVIPEYAFYIVIFLMVVSVVFSKKFIILLVPIIVILPYKSPKNGYYFPEYKRSKSFIKITDNSKDVYFKGFYSDYRYNFIPFLIKNGIGLEFDKGLLNIYDGKNVFLSIKNETDRFEDICVDEINENCRLVFVTNVGYLKKNMILPSKKYVVYNSSFKDKNIYRLKMNKLLYFNESGELKNADKDQ